MRTRELLRKEIREAQKHKNLFSQLFDMLWHKLRINTSFVDYYRFQFYRGDRTWAEKTLYLGESGSRYWPYEGNSLKLERLFVHKSLQKAILREDGIATPDVIMKVGTDYQINSLAKFRKALQHVTRPFLTKIDGGGGGVGILAIDRADSGWICRGKPVDADWIWKRYEHSLDRGFIVEARVENHPVLGAVHPQSLNTLRICTVRTADDRWHAIGIFMKFGTGDSRVDNLSSGGLFAGIDDSGVLGKAYSRHSRTWYDKHPDTGQSIAGLQVPHFRDAVDLALDASRTFGFMATVGWDVAVTPSGPMIIEGNPSWRCRGIQEQLGPVLTPEVVAGLAPRSWWTPWDKTQMFPNYQAHYAGGWLQQAMARRRRRWKEKLSGTQVDS